MGQVGSAKSDTKVNEEIVSKWRRLNPKEKVTYGSTIEEEKRSTIIAIGFSTFSSVFCTHLHRPLCNFLIQMFNPDTSSIELHGNVFQISAADFGRVMGLKNTDEDVQLGGPIQDEHVRELVKIYCGNDKRALVSDLAKKLEKCENANDDFKVRFMMLALGTLLYPTSSLSVSGNYLTPLRIPGKIESKNWANHAFNLLREGVRSFKKNKGAYVNGSLLSG
ncbi:hypothetical protein CerSpe_009320 [Prunus speciosa]